MKFLEDWFSFGKDVGYLFALKYKLGLAQEGIDFFNTVSAEEEDLKHKSN